MTKSDWFEIKYLECNCEDPEHLLRFYWWKEGVREDDPDWQYLCAQIQMSHYQGFFKRVWAAIKYIFGSRSQGWAEALLLKEQAIELRDICNEYLEDIEKE